MSTVAKRPHATGTAENVIPAAMLKVMPAKGTQSYTRKPPTTQAPYGNKTCQDTDKRKYY